MKRKTILSIVFYFLFTFTVFAQGGSNYSIFGLGDIYPSQSASYDGLGGTSIAIPSENYINLQNPALWSEVTTTRMQVGYRFNQHIVDSKELTLMQNNGKIDGTIGLFSIDTSMGLSAGFGFYPYSNVNYLIMTPVKVDLEGTEVNGTTIYQGKGGLTRAFLGGAFKLTDELSFGGAVLGTFGIISSSISTSFYDWNYYEAGSLKDDDFSGIGFRGGVYYKGIKNLSLGAFYELNQSLKIRKKLTYTSAFIDDTTSVTHGTINFPNAFGLGISYTNDKFLVGADYSIQDFSGLNYQLGPKTKYRPLQQFSLGFSLLGSSSLGAKFLNKISYNFGTGYRELYYSVNGMGINEYYGSFGMSIPIVGTSIIDAAVTFGSRGSTDKGMVHEYFGRLTIDIGIGEVWFKPYKREY